MKQQEKQIETKLETTFETLTKNTNPKVAQDMVKEREAGQYLGREVKLDMGGPALHGGQDLWGGGSSDGMDLLYLVHLIGARKQGEQAHHLHNRTRLLTQRRNEKKRLQLLASI